jgi:ATP-dependent DNA helicase DinG
VNQAAASTRSLREAVDEAFSEGGALARAVEGYEPREGQRAMADAVASVLESGGTLLVEAGTGTGKTLAYLIPAILSGRRVLVSTGTKNLQEQIFFKDLPALQRALGVPFTATLMKGRSNYLCLHRFEQYGASESPDAFLLPMLQDWAKQTGTGDRAELRDLPEDLPLWKEIAAASETCLGAECPEFDACFVTRVRQRAAESDVVIVNHHLLCADASVRQSAYGEVIPSCPTLVVDEAHQLEDVATQYFGVAVSNYRIDDLIRDAEKLAGHHGRYADARSDGAGRSLTPQQLDELARDLTRIGERTRIFFAGLQLARSARASAVADTRLRYSTEAMAEHVDDGMMLVGALDALEATLALKRSGEPGAVVEPNEDAEMLARRAGEIRDNLKFLLRVSDPDFVYYVEMRGRGVFLRAAPIDVSRIVQDALFSRMRAIVRTSATLAVDDSFEYISGRLGIRKAGQLRVTSGFDYAKQAILYLPRRMPPPKSPRFAESVAREVLEILKRTEGRAFVLFTSYSVLHTVQRFVDMALPYPVFVQGTLPRSALIEEFRRTPNAVLLATSSFWQGVDVVGEALSCVIIDKLPFASPSEPVTAARIEAITARGGEAFSEYQVPLAILALQQGLGRLIRHRHDRGVLAVLDPRLRTMGYGRRFLDALPPAPVTGDIRDIEQFFR